MKDSKTVSINGQEFDSNSGLPLAKTGPEHRARTINKKTSATSIHAAAQRSQTLYRRTAKNPATRNNVLNHKAGRSMDIARSNSVTHFTKRPVAMAASTTIKEPSLKDTKPVSHPMATKVHKIRAAKAKVSKPQIHKPAKIIKEEAIAEALSKPTIKHKKKNVFKRHPRLFNAFTFSIIFILIAGYFTYLNMPSLSVKIASAQASISATYPEYRPDGYSLSGPITYSDGEVVINFHANTGDSKFIIKQSKSSWDSSAVKNKVDKDSKGQYITTEEKGLTIYTYGGGNASWVNGGILYSITGNAPLSSDQIRRVATSL